MILYLKTNYIIFYILHYLIYNHHKIHHQFYNLMHINLFLFYYQYKYLMLILFVLLIIHKDYRFLKYNVMNNHHLQNHLYLLQIYLSYIKKFIHLKLNINQILNNYEKLILFCELYILKH